MSVPQWNADIITPASEAGGTQVIGDNQEVQTTLESGENITIEDGKISATGDLDQVQSDWTESDTTDPSYIQNKPDLSIYAQSANLATVATSGSYNDLSDKPTIPAAQVNSDWAAASGVSQILNKPDLSIYAQSANLATVATSGDYADLSNKPTIPTVDQTYSASSTNAMSGVAVAQAVAGAGGLPSSTSSDAGKILTVNAQGTPAWGMLGSVTSIQQVNALPASPDANTLYLIPEA